MFNPSTPYLYKKALEREDVKITSTGALVTFSGENTGRCPQAKRIVYDENTKDIDWEANKKISKESFNRFLKLAENELSKDVYEIDTYAGWDNQLKIRTICTNPYHAIFMKNMLIPADEPFDKPDFTIYNASHMKINDPENNLKDNLVALDFTQMKMVIFGTRYAGEMKKGVLTLIMYLAPLQGDLPLHSSANTSYDETDVTLFFGLSGTGKTTLSTEPNRRLVGDDEHVWTDRGVYNVENGNYAKCIGLKKENEPEIFNAIKYGAILENVVCETDENIPNYDDVSITQNTRCAYPLSHIPNAIIPAKVDQHPKNIVLLTCDAFGILPPVSKLSIDQAVYFFVSGYTSKMPGTEMGISEPTSTFSPCFGGPFLAWQPKLYGDMLRKKLEKHGSTVWLLNTGWTNGKYGVGNRISIKHTRKIVDKIHDGSLEKDNFDDFYYFALKVPQKIEGIPDYIINPTKSKNFDHQLAEKLVDEFDKNAIKLKIIN